MKDGGPAFPVKTQGMQHDEGPYGHCPTDTTWQFPGMTIRDYFAAKAMQAHVSHGKNLTAEEFDSIISKWSYEMADAMLKEREKEDKCTSAI